MLTDEEKEFYEKIYKIARREYWKGFITGAVIAAILAIGAAILVV